MDYDKLLSDYAKGYVIYPQVIAKRKNISVENAMELLQLACEDGRVKKQYTMRCQHCMKMSDVYIDKEVNLSPYYQCKKCKTMNKTLDTQTHLCYIVLKQK